MALDTYSNLKTSVVSWSKRSDSASFIDDFIAMTESEVWKRLRIRDMEATALATASSKDIALPAGFIEMRRLRALSGGEYYSVQYVAPNTLSNQNDSGIPSSYTITNQVNFDRATDHQFEMQYYRELTGLSSGNASNSVLSRLPNVYLYGCLWALWQWAMDEQKSEFYYGKFIREIDSANKADTSGRYSNPRMRTAGSTP